MQSSSCWSFKIVELSLQISKEQCSVILCNTAVMTPVHDSNPRMCGHLKPDNPVHTAVFFFFRCFPPSGVQLYPGGQIQRETYAPFSTLTERIFWKPLSMIFWHSSMNSQRLPWKFSSSQTVILHCPICSIICCCVFMVAVLSPVSLPLRATRKTSSKSLRLVFGGDQKDLDVNLDSWTRSTYVISFKSDRSCFFFFFFDVIYVLFIELLSTLCQCAGTRCSHVVDRDGGYSGILTYRGGTDPV